VSIHQSKDRRKFNLYYEDGKQGRHVFGRGDVARTSGGADLNEVSELLGQIDTQEREVLLRNHPLDSKKQKPFSKHTKLTARLVGNLDGKQVDLQEFMSKVPAGTKWRLIMPSKKPLPEA
jgi:hypothetical protein